MLHLTQKSTHGRAITKLSASNCPKRYSMPKEHPKSPPVPFVEDNEIAYICGKNGCHFKEFAQCLVTFMRSQYETVCFECDDCDWAAMRLRSLFQNLDKSSYDTYVYDTIGGKKIWKLTNENDK